MIRRAIAAELKRLNWTPYRLAKESGICVDSIYRFLAGTREITTDTLESILGALGLKIAREPW